jgi:nucleotide-binding universal stress UspA family protein
MINNAALPTKRFLEKLLVATDGSESGERAVTFAIALAQMHESTIEFCDAVDLDGGVNDHHFDAVVVGTAGKVGLERVVAGSTADGVVRRSAIPVFVVPPAATTPALAFETVFVALDDSDPGDAALAFAIRLASANHARLTICSVVEMARLSLGADYCVYDPMITLNELHAAAEQLVTAAYDHARDRNVRCERFVVDGDPADRIIAMAREKGADVIVIGTHGRRGFRRWLLGSVAEAVMRRSDVPVVVVRSLVERAVSAKQSRMRDFAGD